MLLALILVFALLLVLAEDAATLLSLLLLIWIVSDYC